MGREERGVEIESMRCVALYLSKPIDLVGKWQKKTRQEGKNKGVRFF